MKTHKSSSKSPLNIWGWCFVAFSTALIAFFVFYPMVQAFLLSLKSGPGNQLQFTGLQNYTRLLKDDTFKKALTNTLLYLIVQVPIMIFLALSISVVLNDKKLKLRGFYRTAIFLPCVTSLVSYSLIMKSLFSANGLIDRLLMHIGITSQPLNWLTDPLFAKVLIIISITWRWTGYNMIFFLSGLQNIEPSIFEAAEIDGCTPIKKFIFMTVPLLKPIILFTTITSTIGTLQLFDEVQNITGGGPANATVTISQYIYNLCFKYNPNFGYAAAVAFVVFLIIAALSALQFRVGGDRKNA